MPSAHAAGASTAPQRKTVAIAAALLVAGVMVAYANSFPAALLLDDQSNVLENPSIRHLWPLSHVLSPPASAGVGGRPVANLSFALNYALSGTAGWSYHALNIVLHATAAVLLFGLVRRTMLLPRMRGWFSGDALAIGVAVAGVWALHPLQTETIDYVSQRTELLAAVFVLTTLYQWVRAIETGRRIYRWVAIGACALAMATKETAVTTPFVVLAFDIVFVAGTFRAAWRARGRLFVALGSTWLLLGVLMLGSKLAARGVGVNQGITVPIYFATECGAILRYLKLALWPHPLVFDYGWDFVHRLRDAAAAALGIGALLAGVAYLGRRNKPAGFTAGVLFVLLAPTSSIIPIVQQPIAESRMYLPLAALVSLGAVATYVAVGRRGIGPCIAGVLAFAVATAARNPIFAAPETVWHDVLAQRPDNARAHSNLAGVLLRKGDVMGAQRHAERALALRPHYADAETNLGAALMAENRPVDALPHLERAARLQPASADAQSNVADALFRTHQPELAIARYNEALVLDPAHAQAHTNLAVVLLERGRIAEAIAHGEAAVRLRPDFPEAHYNLANALVRAGRLDDAIREYRAALALRPDFASARKNLGIIEALQR